MLKKLITTKLIDYIAMDIKAPLAKYEAVVGVPVDFNKIKKSVTIIKTSGLPYEFRTTIVPGLLEKKDIAIMGKELIVGAEKWYLQKFKSDTELVNSQWRNQKSFTSKDMEEMASIGGEYSKLCVFRG
jgi:pyruvate formate lyase activating enzyme